MTNANLVSHEQLLARAGNSDARDRYLAVSYGFSEGQMREIRQMRSGRKIDRLLEIGAYFRDHLHEKQKQDPDLVISAQFTCNTLAALINNEWDNPQAKSAGVVKTISRTYADKQKTLEQECGLQAPYIHFLREELGIYEGNLPDAKKQWPLLEASTYDWQDSIRIPLSIDQDVAFLAGLTLADASCGQWERGRISCVGPIEHENLYSQLVKPLVRKTFNKQTAVNLYEHDSTTFQSINFEASQSIKFFIDSGVIGSFFHNYLQLRPVGDNRDAWIFDQPHFQGIELEEKKRLAQAVFKGVLAGMGTADAGLRVGLYDSDQYFMQSVRRLASFLEIPSTLREYKSGFENNGNGFGITFSQPTTRRLLEEGYLVNPYTAFTLR